MESNNTNETPGGHTPTPGGPTPTPRDMMITIDIQELETLRDVITYKAQVLRLQERTFKTKEKEQQAAKRALVDFLITLFGYLTLEEAQKLIAKVCKEYNFKLDQMILQSIEKTNDIRDKELQRKNKFKEHLQMKQNQQQNNTVIMDKIDDSEYMMPQNYQEYKPSNDNTMIVDRLIHEQNQLRKSYAVDNIMGFGALADSRPLIQKLNDLQNKIQGIIKTLNINASDSKINQLRQSNDSTSELLRYSISKSKKDESIRLSISKKNSSLNNTFLIHQDARDQICEKIKYIQDSLGKILYEEFNYYADDYIEPQQQMQYYDNGNQNRYQIDMQGIFEERLQPQAYEGAQTARNQEYQYNMDNLYEDRYVSAQPKSASKKDQKGLVSKSLQSLNQQNLLQQSLENKWMSQASSLGKLEEQDFEHSSDGKNGKQLGELDEDQVNLMDDQEDQVQMDNMHQNGEEEDDNQLERKKSNSPQFNFFDRYQQEIIKSQNQSKEFTINIKDENEFVDFGIDKIEDKVDDGIDEDHRNLFTQSIQIYKRKGRSGFNSNNILIQDAFEFDEEVQNMVYDMVDKEIQANSQYVDQEIQYEFQEQILEVKQDMNDLEIQTFDINSTLQHQSQKLIGTEAEIQTDLSQESLSLFDKLLLKYQERSNVILDPRIIEFELKNSQKIINTSETEIQTQKQSKKLKVMKEKKKGQASRSGLNFTFNLGNNKFFLKSQKEVKSKNMVSGLLSLLGEKFNEFFDDSNAANQEQLNEISNMDNQFYQQKNDQNLMDIDNDDDDENIEVCAFDSQIFTFDSPFEAQKKYKHKKLAIENQVNDISVKQVAYINDMSLSQIELRLDTFIKQDKNELLKEQVFGMQIINSSGNQSNKKDLLDYEKNIFSMTLNHQGNDNIHRINTQNLNQQIIEGISIKRDNLQSTISQDYNQFQNNISSSSMSQENCISQVQITGFQSTTIMRELNECKQIFEINILKVIKDRLSFESRIIIEQIQKQQVEKEVIQPQQVSSKKKNKKHKNKTKKSEQMQLTEEAQKDVVIEEANVKLEFQNSLVQLEISKEVNTINNIKSNSKVEDINLTCQGIIINQEIKKDSVQVSEIEVVEKQQQPQQYIIKGGKGGRQKVMSEAPKVLLKESSEDYLKFFFEKILDLSILPIMFENSPTGGNKQLQTDRVFQIQCHQLPPKAQASLTELGQQSLQIDFQIVVNSQKRVSIDQESQTQFVEFIVRNLELQSVFDDQIIKQVVLKILTVLNNYNLLNLKILRYRQIKVEKQNDLKKDVSTETQAQIIYPIAWESKILEASLIYSVCITAQENQIKKQWTNLSQDNLVEETNVLSVCRLPSFKSQIAQLSADKSDLQISQIINEKQDLLVEKDISTIEICQNNTPHDLKISRTDISTLVIKNHQTCLQWIENNNDLEIVKQKHQISIENENLDLKSLDIVVDTPKTQQIKRIDQTLQTINLDLSLDLDNLVKKDKQYIRVTTIDSDTQYDTQDERLSRFSENKKVQDSSTQSQENGEQITLLQNQELSHREMKTIILEQHNQVKQEITQELQQFTEMIFELRKSVCDQGLQKRVKTKDQATSTAPSVAPQDYKHGLKQLYLQSVLSQSTLSLTQIIQQKSKEAILSHFKKPASLLNKSVVLGKPQPRMRGSGEDDDSENEASQEIIPAQLRRYMAYKRERSYAILCHNGHIFIDGLNNNIDVFTLDDFRFVQTIVTDEQNMICAFSLKNKYYFGCQNRTLIVCDDKFNKITRITLQYNAYDIIQLNKESIMFGERRGYLEIFDVVQNKIVHTQKLEEIRHVIKMLQFEYCDDICIAADNGLYFIEMNYSTITESYFIQKLEESYFPDKHIRGVISLDQFQPRQLAVTLDDDKLMYLINRQTCQITKQIIAGPNTGPVCIRKHISQSDETSYILIRDERGVNIVDVETNQNKQIISSVNLMAPYPQQQMEIITKYEQEKGLLQIVLIEYDGRQSILKRYELNENYLGAVFVVDLSQI